MKKRVITVLITAVLTLGIGLYVAAQETEDIPTFVVGQILTADEMNALGDTIRELLATLGLVQVDVVSNTANIGQAQTDIIINSTAISELQTNVATNTAEIDQAQADIAANSAALESGLTVVDSTGTTLGRVVGTPSFWGVSVSVPFRIEGQLFVLNVAINDYFGNEDDDEVLFESADCSGQPFLDDPEDFGTDPLPILPVVAVNAPGNTVYLQVRGSAAETRLIQSGLHENGNCYTDPDPFERRVVPALTVVDMDTLFTPPFSVR